MFRIGAAGWAIPGAAREQFPAVGTGLERYAARFNAVAINTTFYRRHRPSTFSRWAAATPPDFSFALKMPREITHRRKLEDYESLIADLAGDIGVWAFLWGLSSSRHRLLSLSTKPE